jgi:hypothetical protein
VVTTFGLAITDLTPSSGPPFLHPATSPLPSPSPPPPLPFLLAPARSNTQPTDSGTKTSTSLVAVSAHPLLHIIRSSSGVVPPGRNATRTSKVQHPTYNIQHPQNSPLQLSARFRHWQPYDPHTRIAFGETVRTFQSLLPLLAASSPSRLFAEQRRPTRTELASKFSDIALHYTLTCDSLQYSYSIALADYSKVESLPHLFPANFLELKGTFCEHSYWHDGR